MTVKFLVSFRKRPSFILPLCFLQEIKEYIIKKQNNTKKYYVIQKSNRRNEL